MAKSRGRPTDYKEEYVELAFKFCLLGADNKRLADFFDVSLATVKNWMKAHPKFLAAVKKGRVDADAEIASSLYHRAKGYSHKEDKIFNDNGSPLVVPTTKHYPPDTAAAFIWLKNRQNWGDKAKFKYHSPDGEPLFNKDSLPHEQATQIIFAASEGLISLDDAQTFINTLATILKIEEITELKTRLEALEKKLSG